MVRVFQHIVGLKNLRLDGGMKGNSRMGMQGGEKGMKTVMTDVGMQYLSEDWGMTGPFPMGLRVLWEE